MQRAVFLAALVAFQAGCGRVSGPADEGRGADPPWADSGETFCSDLTGSQWVRVWSVPGSVFVGLRVICLANDVCNDALLARGSAFTLYENRGDGWSMRHRAAPIRAVEPYVTGFADGRVVFGTNDCAVLSVDSDSSATCLQHELGDYAKVVTAAGDDTVLALRTTDPDQTDLVRLDEKGASVLESWVGSDPDFLATNGTSVLLRLEN